MMRMLMKRALIVGLSLLTVVSGQAYADWKEPPIVVKDGDVLLRQTSLDNSEERMKYRQTLVAGYLDDGNDAPKSNPPVLYLMGGGGAAGKGTVKNTLVKMGRLNTTGAVMVDPDDIKEQLPEYRKLVQMKDGRAAAIVHEESSLIAKEVVKKAYENKFNIIMDVTLGDPAKGLEQIKTAKDNGYKVVLIGVTVDPALAMDRAIERAERTGRWVPSKMLLSAHKGFSEGFERYVREADVVYLYDTTSAKEGAEPVLVGIKEGWVIKDNGRYAAFMEKKGINVDAKNKDELYARPK
jgi:predicted ABC-type ATPase